MAISVSLVVAKGTTTYELPVAAVGYVLLTTTAVLDTTGRYKLARDVYAVVDDAVIAFGKALADTATATEASAFALAKPLADTATPSDSFSRAVDYIRNYADTYGVTDAEVISFIKRAYDTFTATDAITTITFAKFLADGVAMNDAFDATDGAEWAFTKGVSNIVFTGDSFSRAVDYRRGFSDATYGFSETKFFDFVKSLADNTTTSDTGSLRSQGYCDFSYFAEDYVGDSRTF
jgi:hypothetical protein